MAKAKSRSKTKSKSATKRTSPISKSISTTKGTSISQSTSRSRGTSTISRSTFTSRGTSPISQPTFTSRGTSPISQSTSTTKGKTSRNAVSEPKANLKARKNIVSKPRANVKARSKSQSNSTKASSEHTIFQFKITLRDTWPRIWRRIQISKDTTFQNFHLAVVNSMGWANSHHHGFVGPDIEFVTAIDLTLDMGIASDKKRLDEAKVKLSDYFKNPKDCILHCYDYGDGWEHVIQLEKTLAPVPGKKYPVCLDGKRACPPDDCGGTYRFRYHCKIMSDPKHPEHKETKEWLKEIGLKNWKADVFNPKSVEFWYIRESD